MILMPSEHSMRRQEKTLTGLRAQSTHLAEVLQISGE